MRKIKIPTFLATPMASISGRGQPAMYMAGAALIAGLAVGTGITAGVTTALWRNKLKESERTNASLQAFAQYQSAMLAQSGAPFVGLESKVAIATIATVAKPVEPVKVVAAEIPAPVVQAPQLLAPIEKIEAIESKHVKHLKVQAPEPAPRSPAPAPKKEKEKHVTPPPSTVAELPRARVKAPVVVAAPEKRTDPVPTVAATAPSSPMTITMEQAGIAGMDTTGISFRSGLRVDVGGEFPTGEKLVSISPREGRVVTNRRVILLAKPPIL